MTMTDEPQVQVDVNDIITSLTQQVAEKAGQVALLEAKVIALGNLLAPSEDEDVPEVSDDPEADASD